MPLISVLFTKRGVGTVFQPLFYVFPDVTDVYDDQILDHQIMVGDDLMACPVVEPKVTQVKAYFPRGKW